MGFIDVSAKTIEDAIAKVSSSIGCRWPRIGFETKVLEQPSNGSWALVVNQQLCAYSSSQLWQNCYSGRSKLKPEEQSVVICFQAELQRLKQKCKRKQQLLESFDEGVEEKPSKGTFKEDQQAIAEKGKQFLMICFTQMGPPQ